MKNKCKKKICVVGIGKHAFTNIIPALEKKNFSILGLVSKKPKLYNRKYKIFKYVDLAISVLPSDTIFILCTPPRTHFKLIKKLINKKKNVLVEKPICTNLLEINNLFKLVLGKKYFFYEMFMCNFTYLHKKAINYALNNFSNLKSIDCTFHLPSYPINTFRDSKNFYDNCLYDIGCYIMNFSLALSNRITDINLISLNLNKNFLSSLSFSFNLSHVKVTANIGLSCKYENFIKIIDCTERETKFEKVFYGKATQKKIKTPNLDIEYSFYDINGFEKMFDNLNLKKIAKNKLNSYIKLKETYKNFDILKKLIEN